MGSSQSQAESNEPHLDEGNGEVAAPEVAQEAAIKRMQTDLRVKYLSEIETIQRRVAGDPEAWTAEKLDEAAREIDGLHKVLLLTDALNLNEDEDDHVGGDDQQHDLTSCPVCFESFLPPRKIFSCVNGHGICSVCLPKVGSNVCSVCRDKFGPGYPARNRMAEKLVQHLLKNKGVVKKS